MSKKTDVGLLTWHYIDNVGSNLQAYAIYHLVTDMGYSAEFLNYRKGEKKKYFKLLLKKICSCFDAYLPGVLPWRICAQSFRFQSQFLPQTCWENDVNNLTSYSDKYQMFLCGSDQIWAPNLLDEAYMFSFLPKTAKRFSYAASIGLEQIPNEKKDIYVKYLSEFTKITVREKQGSELIEELLGTKVEWVLDPTFLIEREHWLSIARRPKSQGYIFCYLLGENQKHRQWVEKIAKKKGMPVVCLSFRNEVKRKNWSYIPYMGPREFLGYILNSDFVITDSFHGMALSINLKKDFYILEKYSKNDIICQNSRIYNILDAFGLEERLVREEISELRPMEYSVIEEVYQYHKDRSKTILRDMLRTGCNR